jgi:xylulokinase
MVGERAPYWDEHLRGGLLGLGVYHTRAHLFRAVLEGVAYAMRYSIEAALEVGQPVKRTTLVDGGASSPLWRQIISNVTGLAMDYIPDAKGAPLGDAILAGLGTGVITDHTVIEDWLGEKVKTEPDPKMIDLYDDYYDLYKSSLDANRKIFEKMGEI